MTSTKPFHNEVDAGPSWRESGLRYFAYNFYLRKQFGQRVQHVSIDAGMTCPNVDGTVATGGCVFCDNRSFSPSRRTRRAEVIEQIDEGIRRLKLRYKVDRFLAYFQPATNTYASVDRLRPLYEAALEHPKVLGLVVGTRPDCVPDDVLDLLTEIAQRTYMLVEYGMQTAHDRSLVWMNRGHGHQATCKGIERSRGRNFGIGVHIMLGLPGETPADMMHTADEVARLNINAIKIHNLYAVRNTPLEDDVNSGKVRLLDLDEYVQLLVDFLERIPPNVRIERISGDVPKDYLVGPQWCLDKPAIKAAVDAEFERRDSWQGCRVKG